MDTVKIEGVPPFDGDYPLDLTYFTNRELHTIKQLSGVRAGELVEALAACDNDVLVAVALIAAKRAGREIPPDALWDAPAGKITMVTGEQEEVAGDAGGPPAAASTGPEQNGNGDAKHEPSGGTSGEPSAPNQNGQNPTGQPESATGAMPVSGT